MNKMKNKKTKKNNYTFQQNAGKKNIKFSKVNWEYVKAAAEIAAAIGTVLAVGYDAYSKAKKEKEELPPWY